MPSTLIQQVLEADGTADVMTGPDPTPAVSIVIPHHRGPDVILRCLGSISNSEESDFEIIVVDNNSADGSIEKIEQRYPDVVIVRNPSNFGFARACNRGAVLARGKYIVFLNNDTVVERKWLSTMLQLAASTGSKVLTPKLVYLGDSKFVNGAGGHCDILGFGLNRGNGESDEGQFESPERVFFGSACLMIDTNLFRNLSGYDEAYYMYHEDVDLCWRAQLLGESVWYVPASVVQHDWHGPKTNLSVVTELVARNNLRTVIKNYSGSTLAYILPLLLAVRITESILFATRRPGLGLSIIRGLIWNFATISHTLAERKRIQRSRKVPDRQIQSRMIWNSLEFLEFVRRFHHPGMDLILDGNLSGADDAASVHAH